MTDQSRKPENETEHPGLILKRAFVDAQGVDKNDITRQTGVNRAELTRLLNGSGIISADFAMRIADFFDTTPEYWLKLQEDYHFARLQESANQRRERLAQLRAECDAATTPEDGNDHHDGSHHG